MPSFQDSAVIFFIALLLFGPKKLPELARYIGKLMAEFRRASSEFRMQMDDEFRQIEQAEQTKKIAAMEAAAPLAPAITADIPEPEHPHMQALEAAPDPDPTSDQTPGAPSQTASSSEVGSNEPPIGEAAPEPAPAPLPIATSGDLNLMPPATGLPVGRSSSVASLFDSIPHTPDPAIPAETETAAHG